MITATAIEIHIKPDQDLTFGELEKIRKAASTFMSITKQGILPNGDVLITGWLQINGGDETEKENE